MTDWKGMNIKHTPVFKDATLAILAQNQRFKINGEMQRRPGLASSNLDKLADPVISMWQGFDYQPYMITQVSSTLVGDVTPEVNWHDPLPQPPQVVQQDPLCAVGGSGTGSLITPDLGSAGTCFVNGSITVSANCCYHVRHTISVTSSKTYTGTVFTDYFVQYDINMSPTAGGTCGAGTDFIIAGNSFDHQNANFTLNADGYICCSVGGTLSPTWSFVHVANTTGDIDRYNWSVSVSTTVTNVLCAACHP